METINIGPGTNRTFWQAIRELTGINALADQINGKAGKVQSAWLNLTLTAGTAPVPADAPQYFKDTLGFVHLRGKVAAGFAANFGQLPAGYRPAKSIVAPSLAEDYGTSFVDISPAGNLRLLSSDGNATDANLSSVPPFRAEG